MEDKMETGNRGAEPSETAVEQGNHWFDSQHKVTDQQPKRSKLWTLVVYPDDMPEDWKERLSEKFKCQGVISPLHDKDFNADGEAKKAHYHVLLKGGRSWITFKELQEFGRDVRGVAIPQKCSNAEGMVRYFVHADNPEKAQYERDDMVVFGGFDVEKAFRRTESEKFEIMREILDFVDENDVVEFADLFRYARHENDDWFKFLCTSAWTIERYISSKRNKEKEARLAGGQVTKADLVEMVAILAEMRKNEG
ncbi:TPA: replication protein [Streptococcus suis]